MRKNWQHKASSASLKKLKRNDLRSLHCRGFHGGPHFFGFPPSGSANPVDGMRIIDLQLTRVKINLLLGPIEDVLNFCWA